MATFANREISEYGTITIRYNFATVVARRSIKSQDMVRYTFELQYLKENGSLNRSLSLNNYYLSMQDEWNLLSGIEEAAYETITGYRRRLERRVEELNAILAK